MHEPRNLHSRLNRAKTNIASELRSDDEGERFEREVTYVHMYVCMYISIRRAEARIFNLS